MGGFWKSVYDSIRGELVLIVGGLLLGVLRWVFVKQKEKKMENVIVQENKAVSFKIEGGLLIISVDSNKDGQPLLETRLFLEEVPDEVLGLFKKA